MNRKEAMIWRVPYKFSKGYGWVGIAHCAIFDDGKDNWLDRKSVV